MPVEAVKQGRVPEKDAVFIVMGSHFACRGSPHPHPSPARDREALLWLTTP